jgi:integrase/recombinase XerD
MKKALVPVGTSKVSTPFQASILAGQLSQSSIDMYQRDFQAYVQWAMDAALDVFDANTLAQWRTVLALETGLSPNTINRMVSAVKRLMQEAVSHGHTTQEVASAFVNVRGVKVGALKERTKQTARTRISPEEMAHMVKCPGTVTLVGLRDTALLHTLASSGLRASELASLTPAQVVTQGNGYLLRVRGKNETEYADAHLSPRAYGAIQVWLIARPVASEYIFTSFEGRGDSRLSSKPMTEVAVWQTITKYADLAGLKNVKPHDIRRFVGTRIYKDTKDPVKAQKALRHKRLETTVRHYIMDDIEVGLTDNLY